ncbi:MATE family efflux transporter [Hoeflea sp. AS60]|uniref:MATE family efflux transporter n=1 Tax=Hoeflea sp. AS60 TaxID=3135780 RepID=UPI00316B3358
MTATHIDNDSLLAGIRREWPAMLHLAVPIIVGLSAATLIEVVDTIMIAPLGTEPLAAAGLTANTLVLMFSGLYGLISIISVLIAHARGADDARAMSSTVKNGLGLALISGAVAATLMIAGFPLLRIAGQPEPVLSLLLPYWSCMALMLIPFSGLTLFKGLFDAIDRPWLGVAYAMSAVAINIPLNWLMIHGAFGWPGLGLLGAGIASLTSQSLALTAAFVHWRMAEQMATFRLPSRLSFSEMRLQFSQGWPIAMTYIGEGGAYTLAGLMIGWFGAAALAANQVVGSISAVIYMAPLGMAAAVGIRISEARGGLEFARLRAIGFSAILTVIAWMAIITVLLVVFGRAIAASLSNDPEVVTLAAAMFLTMAFMQIVDGVQASCYGALRGMVDTRVPTLISIFAFWGVALPGSYLFGFTLGFGPPGIWIGFGLGLLIAASALVWRFVRLTAPA